MGLLNARSAKQPSTSGEIHDLIADIGLHVLIITETWLREGDMDSVACGEMTPDGFKLQHLPRASKRGGGLAIIHTSSLQVSSMRSVTCASFEGFSLTITSSGSTLCLVAIYRPPQNSIPEYLNEFTDLIESIITSTATELLVIGDFNIHWTATNDSGAARFRNITESLGLTQHVDFPTHSRGHVLDLIFSSFKDIGLTVTGKDHTVTSDHACILFALTFPCPKKVTKTINIRKLRAIDTESFCRDVSATFATLPTDDCSSAWEQYNLRLQHLLDQHAPMKTVTITTKPDSPWFTFEVRSARRELRRLERQWQKSGLSVHHEMFRAQRNRLTSIRRAAKKTYYSEKFQSAQTMKDRNNLLSSVMQNKSKRDLVLPAASLGDRELAQRFSEFYIDKIKTIRCNITEASMNVVNPPVAHHSQVLPLSSFRETSEDELAMLIRKSPTKSSSLDPIPTWLLKKCLSGFLPILTRLINNSLSSGSVPTSLKKAVIRPLLKKNSLDPEVLKNYRPVSNLPFTSKLLERVVATRLNEHCTENNLDASFQSAYKANHSCETALNRVHNDIMQAVDREGGAILVLLDLSAAFDTLDHTLLIRHLHHRIGIDGTALQWIESYLSPRHQTVCIRGSLSDPELLQYGVPQGSVLGPLLFGLYTQPLSEIIRTANVSHHLYADDTQLYMPFSPRSSASQSFALQNIQNCVLLIKKWMDANYLKLNESKTELLCVKQPRVNYPLSDPFCLSVCGSLIKPSDHVRDLGVMLDSNFDLQKQVNTVCKAAYFELHRISRVRDFIDECALRDLIQWQVISRLDFCNSLYAGLSAVTRSQLQRVQNSAARLIVKAKKSDHITPILQRLHWLPVKFRVWYKINTLTHKILYGNAPTYLKELIAYHEPMRPLRSLDDQYLEVPRYRLESFGRRAFSVSAPYLWNQLPRDLRMCNDLADFKRKLKTFYFNIAFNS